MEEMYQKYKEVAEFRMIYIREAHAVDGARPSGIGRQLNIKAVSYTHLTLPTIYSV